jgi:aspartyl aminopeptidase
MAEISLYTQGLLDFIEASPTPFHCSRSLKNKLEAAGFVSLKERDFWTLEKGGKYMVFRQDSSVCAFILGTEAPQNSGIRLVGAHTDSPNLRLKPNASYVNCGYIQLGVEVYGGVLLSSWLDRDLSIAGRVLLRTPEGRQKPRLIRIDRPIARIPQLAIHLNRNVNEDGLKLNKQLHLPPVLGMSLKELNLEEVLSLAGEPVSELVSYDLQLFDTQKPVLAGLNQEFIYAPRLDNQAMCYAGMEALISSASRKTKHTRVLVCFDHEEVGSVSSQGGNSTFVRDILERLVTSEANPQESYFRSVAKSFFISADMAHATHPNYPELHEPRHQPLINQGPVVKTSHNQRYASNGETVGIFLELCNIAKVPSQHLVSRTDLSCGSTIGPMTTAKLGIRGVDVGSPMLSMHSIREMAGTQDTDSMIKVFALFFEIDELPIEEESCL